MELDTRESAEIFKALGDENRLKILRLLRGEERCACKLLEQLKISQPTLSHHMKILCGTGLVAGRREGKWMYYSIDEERAVLIRHSLDFLLSAPK
ncbi:MAG: metalloregulator ArsR/SmtB family transcription factor [Pyramidobacter sp.]|nr:metalloregulator ArsR/SmtB family transcription factor [Pyramidobacter sp.]